MANNCMQNCRVDGLELISTSPMLYSNLEGNELVLAYALQQSYHKDLFSKTVGDPDVGLRVGEGGGEGEVLFS